MSIGTMTTMSFGGRTTTRRMEKSMTVGPWRRGSARKNYCFTLIPNVTYVSVEGGVVMTWLAREVEEGKDGGGTCLIWGVRTEILMRRTKEVQLNLRSEDWDFDLGFLSLSCEVKIRVFLPLTFTIKMHNIISLWCVG